MSSPPKPDAAGLDVEANRSPARDSNRTALAAAVIILIGVASHLPSLDWGFLYDDYIHQFMLRRIEPNAPARAWSLFDFGARPGPDHPLYKWGFFPWWTDADFKIRFFRPVSSLSIALDYYLYGDWAPGYHLTSLAIFAVFLTFVFLFFRSLGAPPAAALLALAFIALDDIHSLPVDWIANRNSLLSSALTVGCVLAALGHCRTGGRGWLAMTVCCFLLACGAKESGIMALPLTALCLLLLEAPKHADTFRGRLRFLLDCRPLWLLTAIAFAYATFYTLTGHGMRSLMYPTPWHNPELYLPRLAALIPLAGMSLLFGISADVPAAIPGWLWPTVAVATPLVILAAVIILRTVRWTPLSAFAVGWMAISLIPEAGADPSDRLLMSASIGSSLLFGLFLHQLWPVRRALADRRYLSVILGAVLSITGLVLPVPLEQLRGRFFSKELGGQDRYAVVNAEIDRAAPAPRAVFLLNSSTGILPMSFLGMWTVTHHDVDTHVHFLQMGRREVTLHRPDATSLILTFTGLPLGELRYERIFRTGRPLDIGKPLYETSDFVAVPLELDSGGIRRVLLKFKRNLDDPSYQFLAWRNGRFGRLAPPPVGGQTTVPEIVVRRRIMP